MAKRKTKKELAELATRLFNNIDQANQWDNYSLTEKCFEHVDKAFLLEIIDDLKSSVETNVHFGGRFLLDDDDAVAELLKEAREVLGENDELC
jgi:hypothetical protein